MPMVDADDLERFCYDALVAEGCAAQSAAAAAQGLLYADLHGFDTHGVANLERVYLTKLRSGDIDGQATPERVVDAGAMAVIDARRGLGYLAAAEAAGLAVDKARQYGIGAVGVRNSSHCGCVGQYTAMAASAGMIGLGFTNLGAQAILPPPDGLRAMIGTNVIAASAPAGKQAGFELDMSAAVVATGRIRAAWRKQEKLPPGWLSDHTGAPVTDPAGFLDGTAFLQFLGGTPATGAYKGYGLALLIDILCGVLTGNPVGANRANLDGIKQPDQGVGQFFIALNVAAFRPQRDFEDAMDDMLDCLVRSPARPGVANVSYPGLPQQAILSERKARGIPLDVALQLEVSMIARRLGIAPPRLFGGCGPSLEDRDIA